MNVSIFGHRRARSDVIKLTPEGNFDVSMKRICHVQAAVEPNDVVTLSMLDKKIEQLKKYILSQINAKKDS